MTGRFILSVKIAAHSHAGGQGGTYSRSRIIPKLDKTPSYLPIKRLLTTLRAKTPAKQHERGQGGTPATSPDERATLALEATREIAGHVRQAGAARWAEEQSKK